MVAIALLGPSDDPQIAAVGARLDTRRAQWLHWRSDRWPGPDPVAVRSDAAGSTEIALGGTEQVGAAYLRSLALNPQDSRFEEQLEQRPFALLGQLDEWRGLLISLLRILEDRGTSIINALATLQVHRLKPWQIATFAHHGLPVPESLACNDAAAVRAFCALAEQRGQEVVFKPVAGGGYARRVTRDDLSDERLALIRNAPVQFQRRVIGRNLRIFVLDGEVIAAGEILSDAVDYRSESHGVNALQPERAIAAAAITAAQSLGLRFSGVDVIAGAHEFVLLEANPSPMFARFDELAGSAVADRLALALIADAKQR